MICCALPDLARLHQRVHAQGWFPTRGVLPRPSHPFDPGARTQQRKQCACCTVAWATRKQSKALLNGTADTHWWLLLRSLDTQGEAHGTITADSFACWPGASTHLGQPSVYLAAGGVPASSGNLSGAAPPIKAVWLPPEVQQQLQRWGGEPGGGGSGGGGSGGGRSVGGLAALLAPSLCRRPETDVFALGVAAWRVLGGCDLPRLDSHRELPAPPPRADTRQTCGYGRLGAERLWALLPGDLRELLAAALEPEPRTRATAQALLGSAFVRGAMQGGRCSARAQGRGPASRGRGAGMALLRGASRPGSRATLAAQPGTASTPSLPGIVQSQVPAAMDPFATHVLIHLAATTVCPCATCAQRPSCHTPG